VDKLAKQIQDARDEKERKRLEEERRRLEEEERVRQVQRAAEERRQKELEQKRQNEIAEQKRLQTLITRCPAGYAWYQVHSHLPDTQSMLLLHV